MLERLPLAESAVCKAWQPIKLPVHHAAYKFVDDRFTSHASFLYRLWGMALYLSAHALPLQLAENPSRCCCAAQR